MAHSIISLSNVTKIFSIKEYPHSFWGHLGSLIHPNYRKITSVDQLSLTIDKGEFVALIGPNGAGKSTVIKMLTGIIQPTTGSILVDNIVPHENRESLAYKIGALFGQRSQLWPIIPVRETCKLFAGLYGINDEIYRERLAFLSNILEAQDLLDIPPQKLSLGQRMRCDFIVALLHKPAILFLDEPTIGLDVIAKQKVRSILRTIHEQEQTTIILTSHDVDDIEKLTKRTIIINHGSIIFDGPTENLKKQYATTKIIEFIFSDPVALVLQQGTIIEETPLHIKVALDTSQNTIADLINNIMKQAQVRDINMYDKPLEEIIAALYKRPRETHHVE